MLGAHIPLAWPAPVVFGAPRSAASTDHVIVVTVTPRAPYQLCDVHPGRARGRSHDACGNYAVL